MRRFRILVAALAALLIVVAAGCGSSETNDYRGEVKTVQEKYFPDLQKYSTDATAKVAANDTTGASAALDQLGATATKLSAEIAKIKAPSDKQDLANQLVGAYKTLSTASAELKTAISSGDVTAVNKAIADFNKAEQDESAAVDAFNKAD
jgi:outer membrane lipoprotein-sorting protein